MSAIKQRYVVSADPGTTQAGMTVYKDERMVDAFLEHYKEDELTTDRAILIALRMYKNLKTRCPFLWEKPKDVRLVFEYPQIYVHGAKRTRKPDSVLVLVLVVGALSGLLVADGFEPPDLPRPAEWKKSMNKKAMVSMILDDLLLPAERALLGKKPNHNVVDSVGIGLFRLNRMPLNGTNPAAWRPKE